MFYSCLYFISENNSESVCRFFSKPAIGWECLPDLPEYKISKFNAKVSTHYRITDLYSEDICCDVIVANNFFDFSWNVFNNKAIKVLSLHKKLLRFT